MIEYHGDPLMKQIVKLKEQVTSHVRKFLRNSLGKPIRLLMIKVLINLSETASRTPFWNRVLSFNFMLDAYNLNRSQNLHGRLASGREAGAEKQVRQSNSVPGRVPFWVSIGFLRFIKELNSWKKYLHATFGRQDVTFFLQISHAFVREKLLWAKTY